MPLEVGIERVFAAIKGTKVKFINNKAVKKAEETFAVFSERARETVNRYENEISNLLAQVSRLSKDAAEAEEGLRQSNAVIQYQNTLISNAKESAKQQSKKISRFKRRNPKSVTALENGNILETETKWNSTKLEIEKTPRGRKIRYTVTSADGNAQRCGVIDEMTQRRLSTYTKNEHGEATIIYNIAGKADKITANKTELPKLVSHDLQTDKYGTRTLKEVFDDGSTVISQKYKNGGKIEKFDKDNHYLEVLYENNDYSKITVDHFKYKNHRAYLKETTIKSANSDEILKKYTKTLAYDINGKSYSQEISVESKLAKIEGKVSKIDKFGDLEEYTLKAEINPSEKISWNSYKSVEGTCFIKQDGRNYVLAPKEFKITMNNGNQYIARYSPRGGMQEFLNLNNGHEQNVTDIINKLELEKLIEV